MSDLAKRVRRLSGGYQGMDGQESIALEVEALSAENSRLRAALKDVQAWASGRHRAGSIAHLPTKSWSALDAMLIEVLASLNPKGAKDESR